MTSLTSLTCLRKMSRGLLLALALAGCELGSITPAVRQVALLRGEIQVRAPRLYCIDSQTVRSVGDTAVVLIGPCTQGGLVAAALVTVTIGRFASAGVMLAGAEALEAFMASEAGRRALSRSGRARDVEVLESGVLEGRLLLHLKDRMAGEYWRAVIGIKGRLVTISASGAAGVPLTSQAGRKLVDETGDAMIAANPAK